MSIRSQVEFVVAGLTVLALFAGFLYWIDASVAEAQDRSAQALNQHILSGPHSDAATQEDLAKLIELVKENSRVIQTNTVLLHRLDERTERMLEVLEE